MTANAVVSNGQTKSLKPDVKSFVAKKLAEAAARVRTAPKQAATPAPVEEAPVVAAPVAEAPKKVRKIVRPKETPAPAPVEVAAPKKRGRPAKAQETPVAVSVAAQDATAVAPKKRGRPKKVQAAPVEEASAPVPKKRGRPAKVKAADAVVEAPKKRGRPAKTVSVVMEEAIKAEVQVAASKAPKAPKTKTASKRSSTKTSETRDWGMNKNELTLLAVVQKNTMEMSLKDMADKAFPALKDRNQANSWVRNSLRRLVKEGIVSKTGFGTYKVTPSGIKYTP